MIDRKKEVVADLLPRRVEINGNGRIFGVESGDYPREEANWLTSQSIWSSGGIGTTSDAKGRVVP